MSELPATPEKEPALKVGATTSTVAGILSLVALVIPGFISDKQSTIILIISAFALPLITAIFTRGKVWSPASVQELIDHAVADALEEASKKKS